MINSTINSHSRFTRPYVTENIQWQEMFHFCKRICPVWTSNSTNFFNPVHHWPCNHRKCNHNVPKLINRTIAFNQDKDYSTCICNFGGSVKNKLFFTFLDVFQVSVVSPRCIITTLQFRALPFNTLIFHAFSASHLLSILVLQYDHDSGS